MLKAVDISVFRKSRGKTLDKSTAFGYDYTRSISAVCGSACAADLIGAVKCALVLVLCEEAFLHENILC